MLDLDETLLTFLRSVRVKGGVVNVHVVRAAALALIQSNPSKMHYYANFDMSRSWVQSVYRRMGYTKRLGTTGRPPIPKGIFDECRLTFLQDISSKVTEYNIPPELVINADQTPSSYVSVGKQTMAKKRVYLSSYKRLDGQKKYYSNFLCHIVRNISTNANYIFWQD